ncbi:hypothetical protein H6F46_14620 [Limnothrix sp. FACHB-1083]|uniref:hypothetical protein n=1 Tax=unclassified Limnothrix TaxID=2632864 RepID=UPI00167FF90C|nr:MULTISPECIES: hypothetical protein [unclassified Limnothrix]MBD2161927.1 hypothetical protein [Limnothrix sp. FACHB-1083]MBD2192820.1 hypothetical protein [Limnothrix sp. FACHB-1088]
MMTLQPLHPVDDRQSWISGEVTLDPTATIAPGVLLQADPGSRITIGPHVTIGMGAVVHACQGGQIVLEASAHLGAAVLLIGAVRVGRSACIGPSTTVLNQSIAPGQRIAPGQYLGDSGLGDSDLGDSGTQNSNPGNSGAENPGAKNLNTGDLRAEDLPAAAQFNQSSIAPSPQPNAPVTDDPPDPLPSPWDEDDEERQDRSGRFYRPGFSGSPFPPAPPAAPPLPEPVPYQAPPGLAPGVSPIQPRPIATPAILPGTSATSTTSEPLASTPTVAELPPTPSAIVTQTTEHQIVEQKVEVYGRSHVNRLLSMMFPYQQSLNGTHGAGQLPSAHSPGADDRDEP